MNYVFNSQKPKALVQSSKFIVHSFKKKSPRESYRIEKKQQKSDSFSRADENVSALGVQNVTSQLLIKPMQR